MAEQRKGLFVIQEILEPGSAKRKAIRFEWDNEHRNSPFQPWDFGLQLRTKRTDYPGADDPTEQVLGPNFTPFTLRGRWSDKFNYRGYALETRRQFEDMARAGNRTRLQFNDIFIEGLITGVNFSFKRDDEIGWEFTFSPHHRQPGGFFALPRSPRKTLNIRQLRDEVVKVRDDAFQLAERAPFLYMTGTLSQDSQALLDAWDVQISSLDQTINNQLVLPKFEPAVALRRISSVFAEMGFTARAISSLLADKRSDTDLAFETAALVLEFDVFVKGLNAEARNMFFTSNRAAREVIERVQPNAISLYRPQKNEHLYGISQRFYNTPFNWRVIASRNHLGNELVLTGEELLVIPEAATR